MLLWKLGRIFPHISFSLQGPGKRHTAEEIEDHAGHIPHKVSCLLNAQGTINRHLVLASILCGSRRTLLVTQRPLHSVVCERLTSIFFHFPQSSGFGGSV